MIPLNPVLALVLDLAGTFVFALSGALLAVRKRFDLVGLVVLAEITAIGGGVIRDLILGADPPAAFRSFLYWIIPLGAALLVFFAHPVAARVSAPVLVTDAAGLALYCVIGAAKAVAYGLGPIPAIALGVTTAVGGGMLRDLLAGEVPTVLRQESELYAIPACFGATIVVLTAHFHAFGGAAAAAAVLTTFLLRLLAMWRHWHGPRPLQRWHDPNASAAPKEEKPEMR
jgi:uncharacterized membrane protein YeiH